MADRRITDYIQRMRRTYTRDAIRERLLRKGYPPDRVDEAFRAVESGEAPPEAQLSARGWLLYAGYILLLYALIVAAGVVFGRLPLGFAAGVGAVFLVLAVPGAALFAAMSRSLALGMTSGIVIAAIIPFVVIVILGGSCVALLAATGVVPTPTSTGTIELRVDPPLEFSGSGQATCQFAPDGSGVAVFSHGLGVIDGDILNASVNLYRGQDESVSIDLAAQDGRRFRSWFSVGSRQLDVTAADDWSSGQVDFEGLQFAGEPGTQSGVEALSGSLEWECPLP